MTATITTAPISSGPISSGPISSGHGIARAGGHGRRVHTAVRQPGPSCVARRSSRPSEATFRRRRAVVGTLLAIVFAAGLVLAHDVLVGSGGVPASAAESRPVRVRPTVVARPGDTLWSIASQHHGSIELSRYVDTLVDLNGGAAIQAGQAVILP